MCSTYLLEKLSILDIMFQTSFILSINCNLLLKKIRKGICGIIRKILIMHNRCRLPKEMHTCSSIIRERIRCSTKLVAIGIVHLMFISCRCTILLKLQSFSTAMSPLVMMLLKNKLNSLFQLLLIN